MRYRDGDGGMASNSRGLKRPVRARVTIGCYEPERPSPTSPALRIYRPDWKWIMQEPERQLLGAHFFFQLGNSSKRIYIYTKVFLAPFCSSRDTVEREHQLQRHPHAHTIPMTPRAWSTKSRCCLASFSQLCFTFLHICVRTYPRWWPGECWPAADALLQHGNSQWNFQMRTMAYLYLYTVAPYIYMPSYN